jgi:hypothetical protein
MLGTLTIYPAAPQTRSKPVQFDEDEDEDSVLKKLAARKKKKKTVAPAPRVFQLRQTPEGTLVSGEQSTWDFLVTREDVEGYDCNVDELFGASTAARAVLTVPSVGYEADSGSGAFTNLLRAFSMLRARESTNAEIPAKI